MSDQINISTVTPLYRGAKTIRELVLEIEICRNYLSTSGSPLRIIESIFVDDGSTDGSAEELEKLEKEFPWIKAVYLSKNFGQHPATIAGILYSSGDWIVTLDEDLQHRPEFIVSMIKKAVFEKADIVYANSSESIHGSFIRDFSSRFIKSVLCKMSGNKNMPYFNSFRLIRGSIARAASAVAIDQTYFDVALSWFTDKVSIIRIPLKDLRYLETGKSGYTLKSLFSHASRLLQSSNIKYIRLGAIIGFFVMLIGIIGSIIVLIQKTFYPELITSSGWSSLIIGTLLLGGLNAFLIGLALEKISIILMQTHGKPKYFEVDRNSDITLRNWFENNSI